MCQLVPSLKDTRGFGKLNPGDDPNGVLAPKWISGIVYEEEYVIQCWHPETDEWSTMPPPVEGMMWELTPGSKIRRVQREGAPAPNPTMLKQVERVENGEKQLAGKT